MKTLIRFSFNVLTCVLLLAAAGPNAHANSKRTVTFQPPPGRGQPVSSAGGGTRNQGKCPLDRSRKLPRSTGPSILALVPGGGGGLTLSPHPTLWIEIAPTSAKQLIFYIREEKSGKNYYQSIVNIADGSTLIPLSIPANLPGLETGKIYLWSAVIVCGDSPHPDDPSVTASIERIELTSTSSLSGLDLVAWYAERGIWYDALDRLALLGQQNPDDPELKEIWRDLLRSTEVDDGAGVIANPSQKSGK
ncbi:MAG: hypothetical protein N5P05_000900 [Chroococcopsis gigantea SAG 12.99]|nr:DUF928 domain-containing protein [Chlorogloea purpurea SAG 13.99]MDV2999294.1 hypothetical protein [Chroococcopsis gigantea SAG 12.99]